MSNLLGWGGKENQTYDILVNESIIVDFCLTRFILMAKKMLFFLGMIRTDQRGAAGCASSVACLGFLCQDCCRQLLGVRDVGAPGHHPAHQLGWEDVAQVDVNLLPGVAVAAVRRRFRVLLLLLLHVGQGWRVGGH